ncbi:MAG: discoidin domain-containing protein, partial [Sedimentisphaerales bacterium]
IKFDLGELDVGNLETATLTVALHEPKDGDRHFDVSYVNDDCLDNIGWDERSITWNNAPGNNTANLGGLDTSKTTLLTTVNFTDGVPGDPFTIDVLEALQADTDGIVQFVCHNSNGLLNLATHDHAEETWRPFVDATEGAKDQAKNPYPAKGATEVRPTPVLSWTPGSYAEKHDVYLGTNFDDVNAASTTVDPAGVYQGRQDPNQFPVIGTVRLEIGATYYWRIDGVGAAPGNEIYRGKVWQLTVEPYAYAIDGGTITARASSSMAGKEPENTVNGSGLDETGLLHSNIGDDTMWLSSPGAVQPTWIEYDLGKVYELHEMWVWNSNEGLETTFGIGFKEVLIEYSADGTEFVTLGTTHEFTQAPGDPDYAHNTTVDFSGIAARYVRLTANSNWFGIVEQYSLSEVRFFYVPVHARDPKPASGQTDVPLDVTLGWTAGREAAEHNVYLSTSEQAVTDGTAFVDAVTEAGYGPLSLNYATTYYWRVDEVNDLEDPAMVEGDIWSFTTKEFLVIDDFELYDSNDNQIWYAWKDGLGYGTPDVPPYYPGNGTGAAVGDETTDSFTEETIIHEGGQAMPFAFDNNKQGYARYSEAELTLSYPRDWTEGSVKELSLWFRGSPASVGSFTEAPAGTYTMTASGADIWNQADEFHYAFKMLTGPGSIIARVESVEQTDDWAKAGVMIRETLDAGSKFAAVYITPTNTDGSATNGCRFQTRKDADAGATSDSDVATSEETAIVAPYWVKLERDVAGNFRGYYSSNGATWQSMAWNPQSISMSLNVYVGLALTSHDTGATCQAKFSGLQIAGTVGAQWANQDIGILSNDPEPMYVAVSNSTGEPVVVVYDDPAATHIATWTEWVISLQDLADQGLNLTDVDRIAIGIGTRGNMTAPGGSGKMLFDDIRLYGTEPEPEPEP